MEAIGVEIARRVPWNKGKLTGQKPPLKPRDMTLSDFIEANLDGLIHDWTEYARTVSAVNIRLSEEQLRNPARQLLAGIAADMRDAQSPAQ